MDYDMCKKEDFETICNLIKNSPKGTTWRVLRYEFSKQNKTQKSGQIHAPGFTTPLDDDSSTKANSVNVGNTIIKGHGRKVAARGKVGDGKAASKGSTAKAKPSKKAQCGKVDKGNAAYAPGFTVPSDDNISAKAHSMGVDKTIKGHGRKMAAKGKVSDGKAASKGDTTKAKSSKKAQRRKVGDGKAASSGGTAKAKTSKKVTAKKAMAPKSVRKSSAKITKKTAKEASAKAKGSENASAEKAGSKNSQKKSSPGSKKGEVVVVDRNDSDDDSLDLDNMERMSEDMEVTRREDRAKKPLVISLSAALANVAAGSLVYICSFPRPGTVFYAKAGFFKRVIKMA